MEESKTLESGKNPTQKRDRAEKKGAKSRKWGVRRSIKIAAVVSLAAAVGFGGFMIGSALLGTAERNVVDLDYGSVVYEVKKGETFNAASDYSAIDIFGRLNWTFMQQTKWYSEMHGIVSVPMINMEQDVSTYKQYDNDVLISADLTKSSMVNAARQFCYLKDQDRVIWREAVDKKEQNGLDTVWQTGEPARTMTIDGEDGFKAQNGLPAYELTVYVIEPNSVLDSSVESNDDGTFTVSFDLKPENWLDGSVTKGATAYYINQMIFSGGLPAAPVFDSVNVSFTYNSDWEVLKTTVHESYNAQYGPISAGCISDSTAVYEYNTAHAESAAFDEYFSEYADGPVNNEAVERELEGTDYLVAAFGDVLEGPATLSLDLDLNGKAVHGGLYLDLGGLDFANLSLSDLDLGSLSARLKLEDVLNLWLDGGKAYLSYGGVKVSLAPNELIDLFSAPLAIEEETSEEGTSGPSENGTGGLLDAIVNGELIKKEKAAELHCVLPLFGMDVGVDFYFFQGENNQVSLNYVSAFLPIEGFPIGIRAAYSNEEIPALCDEEKPSFPAVLPYAKTAIALFMGDALHADLAYRGDGFSVQGELELNREPFAVEGTLSVALKNVSKTVGISYAGGEVYLNLDGVKLSANVEEAAALLTQFLGGEEGKLSLDLSTLIDALLSPEFAANLSTSEEDGALRILLKGTELLKALGLGFDLGDAEIEIGKDEISAKVYGVSVVISEGEAFEVETNGYTEIVKYAGNLIDLFRDGRLKADVSYEKGALAIDGTISIDFSDTKDIKAKGNLKLRYKGEMVEAEIYFGEDMLLLDLEGIKVKANVADALELFKGEFGNLTSEESDLLSQVLSLKFGDFLQIHEEDDNLAVCVKGTELLNALGVSFDLGEVKLTAQNQTLSVQAYGADIYLSKGEKVTEENGDDYADILPAAEKILALVKSGLLKAQVSYQKGELKITGELSIDFKDTENVKVFGNLTLTYRGIPKEIKIGYLGKEIYLDLDGVKLSANVTEAIELVKSFIGVKEQRAESDLIKSLLSLDFGELLKVENTQNETLKLTLKGTELLKTLGLGFDIGDAEIEIGKDEISAKVYGVSVVISEGEAFEVETNGYTEIVKYAKDLIELFRDGTLKAAVKYEKGSLSIDGDISIDFSNTKDVKAKGNLKLHYKEETVEAEIYFGQDMLLLDLAGIKVKAKVADALELFKGEFGNLTSEESDLLSQVLSLKFGDFLKISEEENSLSVCIKGTELLNALGVKFDLGEVTLKAQGETLFVQAYGAEVLLTKGEKVPAENGEEYADILPAAEKVLALVKSGLLKAQVSYQKGELKIAGELSIDFKDTENVKVLGNLTLTYRGIPKDVQIGYLGNVIYLDLDGVKLSANVTEAIELVKSFIGVKEQRAESDLIKSLLSLDFGDLLKLENTENETLKLTLKGTELLKALGLGFDVGDAEIEIGKENVTAKVKDVTVTLTEGEAFEVETDGYTEIVKYAKDLIELFRDGAMKADVSYQKGSLAIEGDLAIDFSDTKDVKAKGNLKLRYKGEMVEAEIYFGHDMLLLDLEGVKVKASVEDALELFKGEFGNLTSEESDLLSQVLSLKFGDFLQIHEEDDNLAVCVKGTELLNALGIKFDLGEVNLKAQGETLFVQAYGAEVLLTKGKKVSAENGDEYADILPAAEKVLALVKSGLLKAQVSYQKGELKITGDFSVDFKETENVKVFGNLTLTYRGIPKEITIGYLGKEIYLDLDGVKLSANVEETIELIKSFVGTKERSEESDLIQSLLSLDFGELLKLENTQNETLKLTLKGTELLKALGLGFDLGDAEIEIGQENVTAKVYGVSVVLTEGEAFEVETENYIPVMPYARAISELLRGEALSGEVVFRGGDLTVTGTISLNLKTLTAQADLNLRYQKLDKTIKVLYAKEGEDGYLYLTIEGLKLKVGAKDGVEIVKSMLPASAEGDKGAAELLEKLLNLSFGDVILPEEKDDTLQLTLFGEEILSALGADLKLGKVLLSIGQDGTIFVSADEILNRSYTLQLRLKGGKAKEASTEGYYDITPVLKELPALMNAKELAFSGSVSLDFGKTTLYLEIDQGVVSFGDGFNLYLDTTLTLLGARQNLKLTISGGDVWFAYGALGAHLYYTDFTQLQEALLKVYDRFRGIVQQSVGGEKNPLPEIENIGELLSLLKGAEKASEGLGAAVEKAKDFDWTEFLQNIEIGASKLENGIAGARYKGLSLDVINRLDENGLLGLVASYETGEIKLGAALHADIFEGRFPEMPTIDYLTAEDLADLIDYIGAAVGLVSEKNLSVEFGGKLTSTEEEYKPYGSVKYTLSGKMEYSSEKFPIALDIDGKKLVVSPEAYLHVNFSMLASLESDKSVELDILVFDAVAKDGKIEQDGVLDFYLSVSSVGAGKEGYRPLKLYAPADEVMTLLSGVCAMFDLDSTILNDFMISKWLTAESVGELKAFGESFKTKLSGLLGLNGLFGEAEETTERDSASAADLFTAFRLSRAMEEGAFTFSLNSALLYGKDGKDVSVTLKKTKNAAGQSVLSFFSLENVFNKSGKEQTALSLKIETPESIERETPGTVQGTVDAGSYFNVQEVDTLLLALAKSATHGVDAQGELISGESKPHHYVVNKNFYIDGKATLKVLGNLASVEIKVIAISINLDEEGNFGINVRLEYGGLRNALAGLLGDTVIIKGDSTLDLTIKQSPRKGEGVMLYMKRTQTTEFQGTKSVPLPVPYVLYRALPLSNFMESYMDHLCFMFNLSEEVITKIMDLAGNSGSGESAKPSDLGGWLEKLVSSCSYEKTDGKDAWTLNMNAAGLTGNSSFKEMKLVLTTDSTGYLEGIAANLNIASAVEIAADLHWRNAGGKMDAGVTDRTQDIASTLERAMDSKLSSAQWETQNYLQGQLTTITYVLQGNTLGTQEVVFDPTTGESYASLNYPSFSEELLNKFPGYTPQWPKIEKVSFALTVTGEYRPNDYTLRFISERRIEEAKLLGYTESFEDGKWVYTKNWTYGTEITLPFGKDRDKYIDYFICPEGGRHEDSDLTLHIYTEREISFTAHWEFVEYRVDFLSDGEVFESKTGHLGDSVPLPSSKPEREGYTFKGWKDAPDKFGENAEGESLSVQAEFIANEYFVTIVSEYDIKAFDEKFVRLERIDGKFAWKLTFTYDEKYFLPQNEATERFVLHGFRRAGDERIYSDYLPNVLEDTLFTAVWDERGFDVKFEGTDRTLNRKYGASISRSDMPEVPVKEGYTGVWDFEGETFTVTGDVTLKAKYTPITYIVYGLSRFRVDTFTKVSEIFDSEGISGTEYYAKRFEYTYGTYISGNSYSLHEGVSEEIRGFDFDGWYTERFGEGEKVSVLNDEIFKQLFGLDNIGDNTDKGLEGKNILYANWIDNSVEVHLYSDFDFEGSTGYDVDGYYQTVKKLEGEYNVETLALEGKTERKVRQLGWWYNDSVSGWRLIKDVSEFRNRDARVKAAVRLYALWIEDVEVKVEDFYTSTLLGGTQYNIGGTVAGGKPYGTKSNSIYGTEEKPNVSSTVHGYYVLYSADGKTKDAPGGKEEITIEESKDSAFRTFSKTGMNSWTFRNMWPAPRADFGGLLLQMTFTAGGQSIVLYGGSVVSLDTYTVRYVDENGNALENYSKEGVRVGYHGDLKVSGVDYNFDAIELDSYVYVRDLFPETPSVPEKEGYSGAWSVSPDTEVTKNLDIRPVYSVLSYKVTFVSDEKIGEDWVSDGDFEGKYVYTLYMQYGSRITFECLGKELQSPVSVGVEGNVIELPDKPKFEGKLEGKWVAEITAESAAFTVMYDFGKITYHSDVAFAFEGSESSDTFTEQYEGEALRNPQALQGYTFLGWFEEKDGTWKKITSYLPTMEEVQNGKTVEALWVKNYSVSISQAKHTSSGGFLGIGATHTYQITAEVKVGDSLLVGKPAEGVLIKTSYRFYIDNSTGETTDSNDSAELDGEVKSHTGSYSETGFSKKYGHAAVHFAFTLGEWSFTTKDVYGYKAF